MRQSRLCIESRPSGGFSVLGEPAVRFCAAQQDRFVLLIAKSFKAIRSMIRPWDILVEDIRHARQCMRDERFASALFGVEQLAGFVAGNALRDTLFGWTSMFDLCIQQTDLEPHSWPYLRISPQQSGLVEFRYLDTTIERRQWSRTEPPERTIARLTTFLRQLHWIGDSTLLEEALG